jgi:hypothetical protein
MIPANRWHDNRDGTAWWVMEQCGEETEGKGACALVPGCLCPFGIERSWHPCDGTDDSDERHTFAVKAAFHTYRVSVIPDMVLPIYPVFGAGEVSHDRTLPHVMMDDTGAWFLDGDQGIQSITLPPAARPGRWAVKLLLLENMTWLPPQPATGKFLRPQGVQLIGGPDHGKIAPFGGTHIEPSRVLNVDGSIQPAGDGIYEYRYFTVPYGRMFVGIWIPQQTTQQTTKQTTPTTREKTWQFSK